MKISPKVSRTTAIMFDEYKDIITVKELCQMLKIGKNTAYELIHSGQIKSIAIKRQIRIQKKSVISYLENEI